MDFEKSSLLLTEVNAVAMDVYECSQQETVVVLVYDGCRWVASYNWYSLGGQAP